LLKVEGNITKLVSADRKSSSQSAKAGGKSIQQLVKDCVMCFTDCVTSCWVLNQLNSWGSSNLIRCVVYYLFCAHTTHTNTALDTHTHTLYIHTLLIHTMISCLYVCVWMCDCVCVCDSMYVYIYWSRIAI
jgi:hypothetical protein